LTHYDSLPLSVQAFVRIHATVPVDGFRAHARCAILPGMANLIDTLRTRGVDQAFASFKLNFVELFEKHLSSATAAAYENHDWIVRDDPFVGRVVSAVPHRSKIEELPWEQWHIKGGAAHHRILTLARPPRYDDVFVAPDDSDLFPGAVLGRTWFVVEDPDMCPQLLRGRA
jgi:hypothetical protein